MCPERSEKGHAAEDRPHGASPRRRTRIARLLLHSIGLVLFAVLVAYFWPGIRKTWTQIRWDVLAWSCVLFPVLMAFKAERFRLLAREVAGSMSYRYAYIVFLASYFIGVITPGRVGEFAKVHYLMKEGGVSASRALRPALVDRLFDLLCLLVVASAGWVLVGLQNIGGMSPAKVAAFAMLAIVVVAGPLWARPPIRALAGIRAFGKRWPRLMAWLDDTLAVFYTRVGGICALLTAVSYAIGFYQMLIIGRSIGIDQISYAAMCVITATISLAMLLPVSVSGFGTREAAAILLMGQMYGIPKEQAISFSLLCFGVVNVFGGLVGLVCWLLMPLYHGKGFRESLGEIRAEFEDTKSR